MRKISFAQGEFYHVYNRGVDHRQIVMDKADSERFILGLDLYNSEDPVWSIFEHARLSEAERIKPRKRLVDIVCYCLNPNHFHFLLTPLKDDGISKFMKRLGGYANYFNLKHHRTGSLFEGQFKVKHIESNEHLLHLSSYINLNNKVHNLSGELNKLVRSSWDEYISDTGNMCKKDIILAQFKNKQEYEDFSQENLVHMKSKRADYEELKNLLLEE